MYCSKCGKELKEDENFCSKCGTKIEENIQNGYKNNIKVEDNSKQSNINKIISFIIAFIIVFSIGNFSNFEFGNSKQKKYFSEAVQYLINSSDIEQVEKVDYIGNKIIYYDGDILIKIRYKALSLSNFGGYHTCVYSVNRKSLINDIELENMTYSEEWNTARTENISDKVINSVNKKFFK